VETVRELNPSPDMRKTGIIFADVLMGGPPKKGDDEAAVLGFNNSVDELTTLHQITTTLARSSMEVLYGTREAV